MTTQKQPPAPSDAHGHSDAGAYRSPALAGALASPRPDEITACTALLRREGQLGPDTHLSYFGLAEQDKRELLAGAVAPRRFRAMLVDLRSGASHDVVACPGEDRIVSARVLDPATDGHVPVVLAEFALVEEIVHRDERWLAAMRRRGLTDIDRLRVNPLSAGVPGEGEDGRRLQRCFTFLQKTPDDLGWAHPVDGVTVVVDVVTREVLDVLDHVDLPVPDEDGNFHDPGWVGLPPRAGLKPIEITQPEGPSFTVDEDGVLEWLGWSLQIGFDQREGLVLHNIGIDDAGRRRPVLYRASLAEMVVPYGDPGPQRWFQNFFDCGEYLLGGFANSLELGCDCVGDITYLDAVLADNAGDVRIVPQAICIHEEDTGILWKHSDNWNGSAQSRRGRRLVISFFVTVGNYDYGFYWYFSLDGAIALEVKATGVVFTSAYPGPGPGYDFASELAPGLGAPYHQHLFSARLDMAVDGTGNAVDELEAQAVARGPRNPAGNGFTQKVTRLRTESGAQRLADNARNRSWLVTNPSVANRLGNPVGYQLHPEGRPVLLADQDSDIHRRATYATRHLWVTPYAPDENYPAGDLVNMHKGGAGLPAWTAADRSVDDTDIVLWHTFGLTHFPRPEDWPVMPVDSAGFALKPYGFFDRNPALDIPASAPAHCRPGGHGPDGGGQDERGPAAPHDHGHHHDQGKAGA